MEHSAKNPMTHEKKANWIKILIGVVVGLAVLSVGIVIGTGNIPNFTNSQNPLYRAAPKAPRISPSPAEQVLYEGHIQGVQTQLNYEADLFTVSGNQILNADGSVLFNNVTNVESARLGPDGSTIHFKFSNYDFGDFYSEYTACVNLSGEFDKDVYGQECYLKKDCVPEPKEAPWNYKTAGRWAYTIPGCDGGHINNNMNEFIFIEQDISGSGKLKIENVDTRSSASYDLPTEIVRDLFDEDGPRWGTRAVVGSNGFKYIYPRTTGESAGRKILLGFGELVVVIDLKSNSLIGFVDLAKTRQIIASSYRFVTDEQSDYVLVDAAWEGPPNFEHLIDLSGNTIKEISLDDVDDSFNLIDIPKRYEFIESGLILYIRNIEDIDSSLYGISDTMNAFADPGKYPDSSFIDQQLGELEARIKTQSDYQNVHCNFGVLSSCFGLVNVDEYIYDSTSGLRIR